MNSLIGQSLGRYHILEQLGEGGMAVVYKAYDTRLESEVAVKVIRTENLAPAILERALKRFEREAKALAKLTHANIVKVWDFGEYEGKPYLVMPYLPGGTLKERLQGQAMPYDEAVRLLLPIARAIGFAHQEGMIHRDIKPSNIMITRSGDPMLTDFGIAKIIDEEATLDLTGTSAVVGTPQYMAPEQFQGHVDARTDIYSLGVVLYEMVTGRRPYEADTPAAIIIKQATDPLPRPEQFVRDLPEAVERVLIKALAKRPQDRYQSMQDLTAALEGLARLETSRPQTTSKKPHQAGKTADAAPRPITWRLPGCAGLAVLVIAAIGILAYSIIQALGAYQPGSNGSPVGQPTDQTGLTMAATEAPTLQAASPATATSPFLPTSTSTPLPSLVLPTLPTASPTSSCNAAQFVSDVTIPDGTLLEPGEVFTKTWRFKNSGTCSWTTAYSAVFSSGNAMGGPLSQAIGGTINPGQTVDISINFTAPTSSGDYGAYYQLRDAGGVPFSQIYVQIKVQTGKFAVTSVTFTTSGGCGNFSATANITVNRADTVTYHWVRSDGAIAVSHDPLEFTSAGTKSVTQTWSTTASGSKWIDIYIDSPISQQFGRAKFTCP